MITEPINQRAFVEAMKNTKTFLAIKNESIQKLYLKRIMYENLYDNYRQACRYGIDYIKMKPHLSNRDIQIINEVIINTTN